ncbi:P-loop containing nucleoside triphosphate hydrolase protein [Meredithblackwellia eburnea MCA 4105]
MHQSHNLNNLKRRLSQQAEMPARGAYNPRRGGAPSNYNSNNGQSHSKKQRTQPPIQQQLQQLPIASPPVHDQAFINAQWHALGGRGNPNPKWTENPKGVISNYLTFLGERVQYESKKVAVGNWSGFRCTVVADPSPPPPPQLPGQPSLPPIIQPVIGTGDATTSAKDAEKLAALHACFQLGARRLFTDSNLPDPRRKRQGMHNQQQPSSAPVFAANNVQLQGWGAAAGPGGPYTYESASSQLQLTPQQQQQQKSNQPLNNGKTVQLSSGLRIGLEEARAFMDYYCTRFGFGRPDLQYRNVLPNHLYTGRKKAPNGTGTWSATLLVNGSRIGMGEARNKKDAQNRAYLDVAQYLESVDADLWKQWTEKKVQGKVAKGEIAPHVTFEVDGKTEDELREMVWESRESQLYQRAKAMLQREREKADKEKERRLLMARYGRSGDELNDSKTGVGAAVGQVSPQEEAQRAARRIELRAPVLARKSEELTRRLQDYQTDPRVDKMRAQRASLPVTNHASSVLAKIALSPVVVVLAATGSGKTTQLPQIILDDWILRGDGAKCNIVCTQPRRIAAISVAERVAKERGEALGDSVGYQVRFESKPPKPDGSILFCTTGLFLRRLQVDLDRATSGGQGGESFLDTVTHVCVDEVHERDVDTDLLLFVLRRLLHERRKQGKPEIKVILMSATIDPKLFTNYFADPNSGRLAPVVEVPGRSFPVDKHFLDATIHSLRSIGLRPNQGGWVFGEKSVIEYLQRELVPRIEIDPRTGKPIGEIDTLDMPYPLIALIIAWVLSKSNEGHVLVFLPGWEEIQAVRNILQDRSRYPLLDINFNDRMYEIHVLHSTIPIAEQQAVFEPPPEGVRRIVLSTNIAETSVTIPDVVYVVDSAKCKEKRYDPERRLSQLVSSWTGTSNVLQRAGRAGRHRPGEYYGIVSDARFKAMDIHQTVEMLRTDLANTCMHITGLQLPGLSVEDVLTATIQPPEQARIHAAMVSLSMVGAIDRNEKLTSLGRVLLQLPVEAAIGKLCLLGSFFRCLEQTLTLAAILTNRDPFLSPPLQKVEADRVKNSWTPTDFRSDVFAILAAYNQWNVYQSRGDFSAANAFCRENFLSKPTLLLIEKIKNHILQSLDKAGVLRISAGGQPLPGQHTFRRGATTALIPESLNENGHSLPLLSALIAAAVAPNFAIRISEKSLRTSQDRSCAIHPSSVNSRKNEKAADLPVTASKQLYAYGEKSRTGGIGSKSDGQMFLRSTTMLDPLGYMLFGAFNLRVTESGLECDNWLPIVGNVSALDDVERLKDVLDSSLLRVFEGLGVAITRGKERYAHNNRPRPQDIRHDDEEEAEGDEEAVNMEDPTLSQSEVSDLDKLTSSVARVLTLFADSRGAPSRGASRPETPSFPISNSSSSSHPHYNSRGGPSQAGPLRSFHNTASLPATRIGSPRDSPLNSRPGSSAGPNGGFGGGGWGNNGGDWRQR